MATWQFLLIYGAIQMAIAKASPAKSVDAYFGALFGVGLSLAGGIMLGMRA